MLKFISPINPLFTTPLGFLASCKLEGDYYPVMTFPSTVDLESSPNTSFPTEEGINKAIMENLRNTPSTSLKNLVFKKALSLANKSGFITGIPDEDTFKAFMEICHSAVLDFCNSKAVIKSDIPEVFLGSHRGVYKTIGQLLVQKKFSRVAFRDFTLVVGHNSIFKAHLLGNSIASLEPLMVTMIHKDALEYYTLCQLLEEEPHPSIFKVFISPMLDSATTTLPSLKAWYRKVVKPSLLEADFEIEERDNLFDEVFKTLKKPEEVKSISGLKGWLEKVATDFKEAFSLGERIGVEITP